MRLRIQAALLVKLIVTALVLEAHPQAGSEPKGDPVLEERIAGGVAFDGRLWLRGAIVEGTSGKSGGLVSFGIAEESRRAHYEQGVFDVIKHNHDLWVLRQSPKDKSKVIVSVWRNRTFEDVKGSAFPRSFPLALLSSGQGIIILAGDTVRVFSSDKWSSIPLKGKLRLGVQSGIASPIAGGSIYVGTNMGEWGGGLQRIELQTGAVTNIERRDGKGLCEGPLNSDCDPITAVIPDPQNTKCVLTSVGLVHLSTSTGRILQVCGHKVTVISERVAPVKDDAERKMTEAFFGLAPAADGGFWAITWRALYHYDAKGHVEREYALPALKPVSGIYLSCEIPGVAVVRTDVNWAVSTSGYTPLVIPLENAQP
jgi:hypothetical protein